MLQHIHTTNIYYPRVKDEVGEDDHVDDDDDLQ